MREIAVEAVERVDLVTLPTSRISNDEFYLPWFAFQKRNRPNGDRLQDVFRAEKFYEFFAEHLQRKNKKKRIKLNNSLTNKS